MSSKTAAKPAAAAAAKPAAATNSAAAAKPAAKVAAAKGGVAAAKKAPVTKEQKKAKKAANKAARKAAPKKVAVAKPVVIGKRVSAPESLLLRRKNTARLRAVRQKQLNALKKTRKSVRVAAFKRAEKYAKEYRVAQKNDIRMKRIARNTGSFYLAPEPKLAFVIRIRGINGVSPKVRKILQLLRLRQIHNGVFVRLTNATMQMIRLVEPYIAYGYPSLKSVRELVYKRGFVRVNGQRKPITDNLIIANKLKKQGVVCVEDMIHEIYTVGPNFKKVNKFLWPFKLSSPRGGFLDTGRQFTDHGDAGNHEKYINKLIHKMN